MTDEQIIKTLECCISGDDWNTSCKLCPFESECNVGRQLERLTLNLINRQKAEIERITEKYNCQQTVYLDLSKIINKQADELKRLRKILKSNRNTYKINFGVGTEVYAILDREEFPRGVYKCEVSAYLIDCDSKLYSLLTATNGKNTVVGMQTDIENMYVTRAEAESALNKEELK